MKNPQGLICEPLKGTAQVNNVQIWTEEEGVEKPEATETIVEVSNVSSEIDKFKGLVIKVLTKFQPEATEEDQKPEAKIIKQCLALDQKVVSEILKMSGSKPVM